MFLFFFFLFFFFFFNDTATTEIYTLSLHDALPISRGRPARGSLPLHEWAHLDRAAHARRRDPRGQFDRAVEVVGLEEEVAAERLLGGDERAIGGQRLAVLNPHG